MPQHVKQLREGIRYTLAGIGREARVNGIPRVNHYLYAAWEMNSCPNSCKSPSAEPWAGEFRAVDHVDAGRPVRVCADAEGNCSSGCGLDTWTATIFPVSEGAVLRLNRAREDNHEWNCSAREGFLLTANAAGTQKCSSRTTAGRYLVVCDGFLAPAPNSAPVPAKQLATATADESGTFKSSDGVLSLGGVILQPSVIGTEVLRPDCSGKSTYAESINGQAVGSIHLAFVVSNDGNVIDGISTDPGTVFSCHLTRIGASEQ